jgi:hypothetical protein
MRQPRDNYKRRDRCKKSSVLKYSNSDETIRHRTIAPASRCSTPRMGERERHSMEVQALAVLFVAGIGSIAALLIIVPLTRVRRSPSPQPDPRLRRILPLLTPNERVLGYALQIWLVAPLRRDIVVVTNRRMLLFQIKFFGRMAFDDFHWQDVDDVGITTQCLSATITVAGRKCQSGERVPTATQMRGIAKLPAQHLYALAQEIEEKWREKNRVRDMEVKRAESGGTVIDASAKLFSDRSPNMPSSAVRSVKERLAELKEFYEGDLITAAEYEARKAQVIGEI